MRSHHQRILHLLCCLGTANRSGTGFCTTITRSLDLALTVPMPWPPLLFLPKSLVLVLMLVLVLLPCHRHLLVLVLLLLPLPPPPLLVRHMTVRLQRLGMHHIDDGRPPRHALWVLRVLKLGYRTT